MKKQFIATQEMKDAANALVLAQAYVQAIRPELEKMQTDILEKFRYKWDMEKIGKRDLDEHLAHYGEYCTKWFDIYLISDQDFGHCLTEYNAAFTEKGYKVKEFGYCPLLVAEDMERQAKSLLIDLMEPVTGFKYDSFFNTGDWKANMKKYVDLTMCLLAPYLKDTF